MNLAVHIAKKGGCSYRAWCPSLPGCTVYGHSLEEARGKIREAVHGYLASLEVALPRELGHLLTMDRAVGAN